MTNKEQIQVHRERRDRLLGQLTHGIAVIATSPVRPRNRDSSYLYRFDSQQCAPDDQFDDFIPIAVDA